MVRRFKLAYRLFRWSVFHSDAVHPDSLEGRLYSDVRAESLHPSCSLRASVSSHLFSLGTDFTLWINLTQGRRDVIGLVV
jgi:hypothetical protein